MITESMIPMVVLPVTFLFVLLIILIAKAPRAGAWVVGGLVLLTPLFLWRLAAEGALQHEEAIPLIVVPVTFLFVLLVILLAKAPKVGASLIVALIAVVVLGLFFVPFLSYRHASYTATLDGDPISQTARAAIRQQSDSAAGEAIVKEFDRVFEGYVQEPPSAPEPPALVPMPLKPSMPVVASPIWADGIEQELDADIYPSQRAAVRTMGSRIDKMIRELTRDANLPRQITLFQEGRDPGLLAGLKSAVQQALPEVPCGIEAEMRNIRPDEIGVELHFHNLDMQPAPWGRSPETKAANGRMEIRVFTAGGQVATDKGFVEKPWVDDFATFASTRPDQHFIVTRSLGTCTNEGEANQQALDDARARLTEAVGKRSRLPEPAITATDVLRGGFVVDQFAQSFAGSAGRIWRKALLIDVSGSKLTQLSNQKTRESREMRMSWARMGFSVIGVTVLIGVIYFFLNMATRGYYEWSLRIAGIVLAIVAVISVLMVVK